MLEKQQYRIQMPFKFLHRLQQRSRIALLCQNNPTDLKLKFYQNIQINRELGNAQNCIFKSQQSCFATPRLKYEQFLTIFQN